MIHYNQNWLCRIRSDLSLRISNVIALLFLTILNVHAQDDFETFTIRGLMDRTNTVWLLDGSEEPIEGSPYLYDDFRAGEIHMIDNTIISDVKLRYNAYNDNMEYLDNDTAYFIGARHLVKKVIINEEVFVLDSDPKTPDYRRCFFHQLTSGKVSLLCRYTVELKEEVSERAYREAIPWRFERDEDRFFIKRGYQSLFEIGSRKNLCKTLGDHHEELKSFVKKEKISCRDPEELVKLIDYYNLLEEQAF